MKLSSSYDIRKEFNKKFQDIALKAAISTANGSIKLEFDSSETRDGIISKWETNMYGGNSGIRKPSHNHSIGIIKGVNRDESMEDISEEILEAYPDTTIDFFKRDQKFTGTVKLIFKDHQAYTNAMNAGGLRIGGINYIMEQYVFVGNPTQ